MIITDVKIRFATPHPHNERLIAFPTVVFDNEFIVRDLKIIRNARGLMVTMPSRHVTDHCPRCSEKNRIDAPFCNWCGTALAQDRDRLDHCLECGAANPERRTVCHCGASLRIPSHADIAHPLHQGCRERIQRAVLDRYHEETTSITATGAPQAGAAQDRWTSPR